MKQTNIVKLFYILIFILAGSFLYAKMYKFVDRYGVSHITNIEPEEGVKYEEIRTEKKNVKLDYKWNEQNKSTEFLVNKLREIAGEEDPEEVKKKKEEAEKAAKEKELKEKAGADEQNSIDQNDSKEEDKDLDKQKIDNKDKESENSNSQPNKDMVTPPDVTPEQMAEGNASIEGNEKIQENSAKAEKGESKTSWIGIKGRNSNFGDQTKMKLPEGFQGVVITKVFEKSPAFSILKEDDIITEFNGKQCAKIRNLKIMINDIKEPQKIELMIYRNGKYEKAEINLAIRPAKETDNATM